MLTPEESISIQHAIGADIIMQLDDVGWSLLSLSGEVVIPADYRSIKFDSGPEGWRGYATIHSLA